MLNLDVMAIGETGFERLKNHGVHIEKELQMEYFLLLMSLQL